MYSFYTQKLWAPPRPVSQLFLMMKLTIAILLIAIVQVSATTYAQKITLSEKNAALVKVFDKISLQSGYDFFVSKAMLKKAKPVNIEVKDMELTSVLEQLFKKQEFDFEIKDKSVVIKEKEKSIFEKFTALFQKIDVRGKVVGKDGETLPGATVKVKGTNQETRTTGSGEFFLQGIDENTILVVSFTGYNALEVIAKPELGTITLQLSNEKLDEVFIIGYGTTTRRLSTGSISQVKAADIEKQPISNPILSLQGRVPGAFITQTAGYAGAQINVVIRGQNSFAGSTNNVAAPLYIVDGVPFGSTPVEQTAGSFGTTLFSPLNTIDPNQIESISVLKDADATAIYGSRGANGVVLITTKRGKAGNTNVVVDLSGGFGNVTNKVDMLSLDQYLSIRRQAFSNDGVTPTTVNAPDLTLWDQHAETNFPDLLIGNSQHQRKATFSISGGDLYTQFLFGGNYRHESTVLKANTADDAVQFHLNAQHHSRDNKFGVRAAVSYNLDNNTIPNYSLNSGNYGLPSNFPLYNSNGSLYFRTDYTNPLAAFNSLVSLKSNNMITNASLHYMVLPGLDLKLDAGYNYDNVYGSTITPSSATNPLFNALQISILNNNYVKTYIAEPQINYNHTWGQGRLTAILGGTWQQTQSVQAFSLTGSFTNIQLAKSLAALNILSKASGSNDYKYDSGFARAEFEWGGKYLFSGNIRRDGSSRFGAERPFATFGSGAVAWIFTKENFIGNNLPWLSYGKLKMSYGSVGSDKALQDYAYQSNYFAGVAYGPTTTLSPLRVQNQYLQWETTRKFDAALELGLLKDRIFFTANFFRNRTRNLLGNMTLPAQAGFSSYSANLPDGAVVQNKGLELELSTVNIKTAKLTWNTSFNITVAQNKLLSYPNIRTSNYANTYVVGESLNLINVYHSTGIVNGIATAQDINGDGKVSFGISANGQGDYVVAGNRDPKFYGGLDNTLSYQGFELDFLFQFIKRKATRGDINFSVYPGQGSNLPASILDIPLKYSATVGSPASSAMQYYTASDAAIEDASFIRLKNVSLAYNISKTRAQKLRMSGLQVYVRGQNLITITKYKGLDPETLSAGLPTLRMMTAGIRTTF